MFKAVKSNIGTVGAAACRPALEVIFAAAFERYLPGRLGPRYRVDFVSGGAKVLNWTGPFV